MVQLQVILGKAGIFLSLYTTHCTLQSSAEGPKNVESPNDSESSQLCWAAGAGISLVLRTWHRNPPTLFTGVWGLHMHLLKEFNLFSIQMFIHAYLPLVWENKINVSICKQRKQPQTKNLVSFPQKLLIHLNLPDFCCGKFPVTWTKHAEIQGNLAELSTPSAPPAMDKSWFSLICTSSLSTENEFSL